MTLDEAIQLYTQRAENHEYILHSGEFIGEEGEHMKQDIKRCVSENKQLVEWLTDLKELRSLKTDYVFFKAEAKKLLKAAVEDFSNMYDHIFDCDGMCDTCPLHGERDYCLKWRYADETFKLIRGSENE